MDGTTKHETYHNEALTKRSLWFGVILWFVHLNVVYGFASLSCKWGWLSSRVAGIPGFLLVETILTLASLGLMGYLIYLPWREWRNFQMEEPPENLRLLHDTEKDRRPFLAFVVMLLNAFFFLFVAASFVPIFALNPCAAG